MYSQLKMTTESSSNTKMDQADKTKQLQQRVAEQDKPIAELETKLSKLGHSAQLVQTVNEKTADRISGSPQLQNGFSTSENVCQYDPEILKWIDFSKSPAKYNPQISPEHPGDNLLMRPLQIGDYDKGFLKLLTHLTKVGDISREQFEARFMQMKNSQETYYVTVIENTKTNEIIASGTLVKETKFIHQASARGRVEDVVVNSDYRGKQLGKLLVDCLTLLSVKVGCYKVSLECRDPLVNFYSQFGFIKESNQNYMMQKWWD